jgi:hypothetical protein
MADAGLETAQRYPANAVPVRRSDSIHSSTSGYLLYRLVHAHCKPVAGDIASHSFEAMIIQHFVMK